MPTPTVIACVLFLAGAILSFAFVAAAKTRDVAMMCAILGLASVRPIPKNRLPSKNLWFRPFRTEPQSRERKYNKMYWERYIDRRNPRRIEPLDKPIDTYIMLDTETTGLNPEEGATLIEIGALFVQPGNENSRPKFEQLIDPQHPLTEFITNLTGITDHMLQGMPTAGAAMMRFHQWIDQVWPAGEPLTIIAHNAQFDVGFLDAAERVYDPTSPVFDCKWACTKEMSWELNPQKRHHRVADLIVDYHIGDVEEHRALSDAIQEQMIYRALCNEATRRGKWNGR